MEKYFFMENGFRKIINYLNTYKHLSLGTSQFARYIENLNKYDELTDWTFAYMEMVHLNKN